MKEHPILFNTPMIKAILKGNKTQTRRVIVSRKGSGLFDICRRTIDKKIIDVQAKDEDDSHIGTVNCPYGVQGDLLWVREKWLDHVNYVELGYCMYAADMPIHWDAKDTEHGDDVDLIESDYKWKPSIHMFKKDARLWLKVKDVRVERLQDISEDDARYEGIHSEHDGTHIWFEDYQGDGMFKYFSGAIKSFKSLWDSINGQPRKKDGPDISWKANPWVWVIEFERIVHANH